MFNLQNYNPMREGDKTKTNKIFKPMTYSITITQKKKISIQGTFSLAIK